MVKLRLTIFCLIQLITAVQKALSDLWKEKSLKKPVRRTVSSDFGRKDRKKHCYSGFQFNIFDSIELWNTNSVRSKLGWLRVKKVSIDT